MNINFFFFLFFSICFRDVDQVHDMMDDIAEQQDVAREISDAISNPVAFGEFSMSNERKHTTLKLVLPFNSVCECAVHTAYIEVTVVDAL